MLISTRMLVSAGICAAFTLSGGDALSTAHLMLPMEPVHVGDGVKMTCSFELADDETVYSIKWFKDEQLFATVTPSEQPALKVVELPAISVDQKNTAYNKLVLNNAELETSGMYRCLVSLDGPSFATARSTKALKVVKREE